MKCLYCNCKLTWIKYTLVIDAQRVSGPYCNHCYLTVAEQLKLNHVVDICKENIPLKLSEYRCKECGASCSGSFLSPEFHFPSCSLRQGINNCCICKKQLDIKWELIVDGQKVSPFCEDCACKQSTKLDAKEIEIRKMSTQPTPPKLPSCFKEPSKTLKLDSVEGYDIGQIATDACNYLWDQSIYNRIEVKVGKTYLVVAKLKEK